MKKFFLFATLIAGIGLGFSSCTNGNYDANPSGTNGGINPLSPPGGLDQSFNWGGTDPMSAQINGVAWKVDTAFIFDDPTDANFLFVYGQKISDGDSSNCTIRMIKTKIKAGETYFVDFGNTEHVASFATKYTDPNQIYASALTTPGQIKILEADATHIKGLFFFLSKSPGTGQYLNVSKGYFNLKK